MRRISSADLVRNFSVHSDAALSEPVVITRNGRDRLVLMNTERYHELLAAYSRSERQGDSSRRAEDEVCPKRLVRTSPRRNCATPSDSCQINVS
jgi:PHD/YefM family antitoxin component YafN of YafNO toxin-antitoxin module